MRSPTIATVQVQPNVTPMIDVMLVLRADADLPYEQVQAVMALAASEGACVVGLIAAAPDRHLHDDHSNGAP